MEGLKNTSEVEQADRKKKSRILPYWVDKINPMW